MIKETHKEEQTRKRGRRDSNSPILTKKTNIGHLLKQINPPIDIHNRFTPLQIDETEMDTTDVQTDEPQAAEDTNRPNTQKTIRDTANASIQTKKRQLNEKPPPIILQGHLTRNSDFKTFKDEINKTVKKGYSVKHTKTILFYTLRT